MDKHEIHKNEIEGRGGDREGGDDRWEDSQFSIFSKMFLKIFHEMAARRL